MDTSSGFEVALEERKKKTPKARHIIGLDNEIQTIPMFPKFVSSGLRH